VISEKSAYLVMATGMRFVQASLTFRGFIMASAEKRTFSLPSEHTAFIDEKVASGAYASGSEVIGAGLRALQERDALLNAGCKRKLYQLTMLLRPIPVEELRLKKFSTTCVPITPPR